MDEAEQRVPAEVVVDLERSLTTRISVHGLPLTAFAQCRSASSPGR